MLSREEMVQLANKCRARGCKCLRTCYTAFNRWWAEKAAICTHPNWARPDKQK